jgi:hypothetical protein
MNDSDEGVSGMAKASHYGYKPSDLARICIAPRDQQELLIALTYLNSPLKRKLDNFLEEMEVSRAVIPFLQFLEDMKVLQEQAKLEALLKNEVSVDAYMEMKRQEEAARPSDLKPDQTVLELKARLDAIDASINVFQVQAAALTQTYQQANQQLTVTTTAWNDRQQNIANEFMNRIVQQNPAIAQNPVRQQLITNALQAPAPTKILDINPSMLNIKASPAQLGAVMANKMDFVRELNVLSNVLLENEFDPKEFLKKLKTKPKLDIPRCEPVDKDMICDTITGVCKRNAIKLELDMVNKNLDGLKKDREAVSSALNKLLAENKAPTSSTK